MNIELPKEFTYESSKQGYGYAYVDERNILIIKGNISYSRIMHLITYSLKPLQVCPYCGEPLKGKKITLDHICPQDRGGPTIPENLLPCCADCNGEKGNMNEAEYQYYRSLPSLEKKARYKEEIAAYSEKLKAEKGYEIPQEWLTDLNLKKVNIIVSINFREDWRKSNKYQKIKKMYRMYNHLTYPVIIDRNNVLVDGFYTLMFAEKNGVNNIPIIKLDNVERIL